MDRGQGMAQKTGEHGKSQIQSQELFGAWASPEKKKEWWHINPQNKNFKNFSYKIWYITSHIYHKKIKIYIIYRGKKLHALKFEIYFKFVLDLAYTQYIE